MASYTFDKLKELELSRDEVERIGEALKKEEFRKLLVDYVEEIQNPENKKLYEQEIIQLEKERGVDATFINPQPGYVIKTSVDGTKKCFINICINENIQKPSSSAVVKDGSKGLQWSIPHSLTHPREDLDNKNVRCQVYDVVFHPDTLHMAEKSKSFYNMLNSTACDAIESNFNVQLDRKNLKFPKLSYKGMPQSSIIRKPSTNSSIEHREPNEQEFFDKLYAQIDANQQKFPKKSKKSPRKTNEDQSNYSTPTYLIKHRSNVDIQEFTNHKNSKLHTAIPKELIIEINLPLLKCSSDMTLDVTEKTVQLISEKPSKYKLNLTLPYRVNQDNGNAKFDKDLKKLIITLPVKRSIFDFNNRDDSGVESDHGSPTTPDYTHEPVTVLNSEDNNTYRTSFLDKNMCYNVPEFTCHVFENIIAFTLNVKNVDENSINKIIEDSFLHLKFTSVSSSFYPTHYAFYVKLPSQIILKNDVHLETWDNNVVVQIPVKCDNNELKYYFYGLSDDDLKKKFIEEPSIIHSILQEGPIIEEPELEQLQDTPIKEDVKTEVIEEKISETRSDAINIAGTYESSGDELSCSYSPSKSKGILKRLARRSVGRSFSESSLDDFCSSLDSAVPEDRGEDSEMSTSLKKTVRFSDVIMRQLYRTNSSILGQRKKNQRKSRNKKKAQERRQSESETSEIDDRKDEESNNNESAEDKESDEENDIFDMDLF